MVDGKTVKLGDVAHLGGGYAFKSTQYTDSGRFVLRTVNIRDDYSITKEGATFISEIEAVQFERFSLQEHDTLFVMVAATLGKIGYVRAGDLPALLNQNMWVIRAKNDLIDPVFLHYLFRELSRIPLSWVGGSARSFLRRDDVRNLEFVLPSRSVQKGIAKTLLAIDDKIDLNQRMSETLETMARAIFKDWFVDFGPTRAKAEGRAPYLAPEVWDLCPDALDEEDKPVGWPTGQLSDLFVLQRGFDLPKSKRTAGNYPVMAASGLNGSHNEFMVPSPGVTTGRSGVLGKVFFVHDNFWPLNTSLWVKDYKISSPAHAYFKIQTLDFDSFNAGSAVPTLNRNHVHNLPQTLPSIEIVKAFDAMVMPLLQRQRANELESKTLAQTRDLLLPKLMSGEIRLREAEKAVEVVA